MPATAQATLSPPRLPQQRLAHWLAAHQALALATLALLAMTAGIGRIVTHPPAPTSEETPAWWPISLNVAEGRGYTACYENYFPFCSTTADSPTAMREPVPVLLFAAVAALTRESLLAASLVELALHAAIVVAVFFLARELFDPIVALVAAGLWAIYPPALKMVPQVSGDLTAALMMTAGMYWLVRARRSGQLAHWLVSGLCWGLAVLSRSAALAVAGALAAGIVVEKAAAMRRGGPGVRQWAPPIVGFVLAISLAMSPWVIRNELVFHSPVLTSTLTAYNLYRHNHVVASDGYLRIVGSAEAQTEVTRLMGQAVNLPQGTVDEVQMSAVYQREALQIIKAYPVRYLALSAYRFLPLWFDWQVAEAYGRHTTRWDAVIMALQASLLALALTGLANGWRQSWPLALAVVATSAEYMVIISLLRYIVPVMPLVIILSAAGMGRIAGAWRARKTVAQAHNVTAVYNTRHDEAAPT